MPIHAFWVKCGTLPTFILWLIDTIKKPIQSYFNIYGADARKPIKRSTVFKPENEGGLSVINCLLKANTIMLSTFIKCYTHDEYKNALMFYYCYMRLNNILPSEYNIHNASPSTTPYYEEAIRAFRKTIHLPGFPNVPNEKIYTSMLSKEKPLGYTISYI